jgi:CubicO group peptidase (beta-lactamase class C family)
MRNKGLVALATAMAIAVTPVLAAEPVLQDGSPQAVGFSPDGIAKLDAMMDAAVANGDVAGIQGMLVRHGKIVDFHMRGRRSLTTNSKLTRDTIFRMYSQTKPMTGVAMMILYEKGLWKLDDPITKFIPEFAHLKVYNGNDANGNPVIVDAGRPPNMRELMTHTAGFGYGLVKGNPVDNEFRTDKVLRADGLHDMIQKIAKIPLLYQPGTNWSYSVAVDIQGYIVEKLSGQTFGAFMAENIWKPLGMKDTGFQTPPGGASRLSGLYLEVGPTLVEAKPDMSPLVQDFTKKPSMESGGGGSVSTADDYARFCQMILNKGEYNGVRILKPETVALMQQNHIEPTVTAINTDKGTTIDGSAVGFGIDFAVATDPVKAKMRVGQGTVWWGGAAGTWFWIDPKNDLFFIGMIQKLGSTAGDTNLGAASQELVYSALTHPEQ